MPVYYLARSLLPPWPWTVSWQVEYTLSIVCYAVLPIVARLGANNAVKAIYISYLSAGVLCFITATIGYASQTQLRAAAENGVKVVSVLIQTLALGLDEARLVMWLLVYCVVDITFNVITDIYIYESTVSASTLVCLGDVGLLIALTIVFFRQRELRRSRRLVLSDQACYERLWAALQEETPDMQQILASISETAARLVRAGQTEEPRQRCHIITGLNAYFCGHHQGNGGSLIARKAASSGDTASESQSAALELPDARTGLEGQPMRNLDQLFVQVLYL